ncbi:hypothetical protein [Chitinimonas arctica]|nr:hypothetical protein [Chitinimonas arctica]
MNIKVLNRQEFVARQRIEIFQAADGDIITLEEGSEKYIIKQIPSSTAHGEGRERQTKPVFTVTRDYSDISWQKYALLSIKEFFTHRGGVPWRPSNAKLFAEILNKNPPLPMQNTGVAQARPYKIRLENVLNKLRDGKRLVTIDLSGAELDQTDAISLADTLSTHHCSSLQKLVLNDNPIGDKGIEYLAGALKKYPNLHALELRNQNISGSCCAALAGLLKNNLNLKVLDLAGNGIDTAGASELKSAIGNRRTANTATKFALKLGGNNIEHAGVKPLAKAVSSGTVVPSEPGLKMHPLAAIPPLAPTRKARDPAMRQASALRNAIGVQPHQAQTASMPHSTSFRLS